MVDSHFHVQLTAVLDVLMKTAVSDICALADSWFKSVHMELARSHKENDDLRQKLQSLEQQKQQQLAAAETAQEANITKEEKDADETGCTVFAGTSTKDLSTGAHLWPSSSEEESKQRNYSVAESVTTVTAHLSWSQTPVSTKAEMMDSYSTGSVIESVAQTLDDAEENSQCFALQTSEGLFKVASPCKNESDECVLLEDVCDPERPRHRSEDKRPCEVSCLWSSDLERKSTHLHRENQSTSTNSDRRNLGKDWNVAKTAENAKHVRYTKSFSASRSCEKGRTFTCNVCGKHLSTKNSLASHYRLHTREKLFMCALCGKSFAKKFNLDIHYNTHTGVKPYMCAHCPKSFADPSAFRRHKWIHTRKSKQSSWNTNYRFGCNTRAKCVSKASLSAHSQLHTTEKRQKVLFEC